MLDNVIMFNLRYPKETAALAQPMIGDRNYVHLLIQNLRYLKLETHSFYRRSPCLFHRNTAQSNRVAEEANRLYGRDEASRTRSELLLLECRYESCASERLNCTRRSGTRSVTCSACYPNVVSDRATR